MRTECAHTLDARVGAARVSRRLFTGKILDELFWPLGLCAEETCRYPESDDDYRGGWHCAYIGRAALLRRLVDQGKRDLRSDPDVQGGAGAIPACKPRDRRRRRRR